MLEIIVIFFLMIPIYIIMILSYFYPKESLLLGKRWAYKEEPEVSDAAIRYTKIASVIGVFSLTLFFFIAIAAQF